MDFRSVFLLTVLTLFSLLEIGNAAKASDFLGESKIVKGTKSSPGSFPYMAALTATDRVTGDKGFICGSILVSLKALLTGASCVDLVYNPTVSPVLDPTLRAVVGTNQWYSGGGDNYKISHNVSYPKRQGLQNDLAVLFTTTCIKFSQRVWPVTLDFEYVKPGVQVKIAGWGALKSDGDYSRDLYELQMTTLDELKCLELALGVSKSFKINYNTEICIFNSSDSGGCYGDTAAPLVRLDRRTVVGMISWGFPCAIGGPDLAVRFSAFQDWIIKTVFGGYFIKINDPKDWKKIACISKTNNLWC